MATFAVVVEAWVGRAVDVELLLVPTVVRIVVIGTTTAIDCDAAVLAKPSWLVCSLESSPNTACGGRGGGGARCGADECCHSGVALVLFEAAAVVVVVPFLCSSPARRFRNKDSEVATVAGGGGGVVLRVVLAVLIVVRVLLNGVSEPLVSRKVAKNDATSWPASMLRFNASDGVEVATELGCCCFFCVMLLLLLLLLLLLFPKRGSGAP
jgi:hypothetical protein